MNDGIDYDYRCEIRVHVLGGDIVVSLTITYTTHYGVSIFNPPQFMVGPVPEVRTWNAKSPVPIETSDTKTFTQKEVRIT